MADQKFTLESNKYGKTNVKVMRIHRGTGERDGVLEMQVECLLKGPFERSYTHGDNKLVIPTDTVKQTCFAMAKESTCNSIEDYAMHLSKHFLATYAHVTACEVRVDQVMWNRIPIHGQPHKHSFTQSKEIRTTFVTCTRKSASKDVVFTIESGVKNLTVLKTHGSGWVDYHDCKFTVLKPVKDRLLSTDVSTTWKFNRTDADFNKVYDSVLAILLEVFATKYSPGVQNTVWEVGTVVLDKEPSVDSFYMKLPNKHYWHYDIERFGYENHDEVYAPQTDPSGLIEGRVTRKDRLAKL